MYVRALHLTAISHNYSVQNLTASIGCYMCYMKHTDRSIHTYVHAHIPTSCAHMD